MPKYSIVVPVYNVEEYLHACIQSVLAQSAEADYELLLIDDGSTDRSGALCDDFAAADDRVRVIHSANHGVSHARNLGIGEAAGDYILFLDADDLWEEDMLSVLSGLAEKDPDMMVFADRRLLSDGTLVPDVQEPVIPAGEPGTEYLTRLFSAGAVPRAYCWCYAFRRELLSGNQIRFREDMKVSEDFVLVYQCLAAAGSVVGTSAPLYRYRQRLASATAALTSKKLLDNLTSKAEVFRAFPVAALANVYGDNALLVAGLPKAQARQAMAVLRANRDIWDYVSQTPLKFGARLVALFGDYEGARVYRFVRGLSRRLRGRGEC